MPARVVSWEEVSNRSLARVGADRIEDLDEGTENAGYCNLFLQEAVDIVCAYHPWRSTKTRIQLSPDATPPAFGWDYRFQLPLDFLTFARDDSGPIVENESEVRILFEIEGTYLMTDSDTCFMVYHRSPSSPVGLPPGLVAAIVAALARKLCPILSGNDNTLALVIQEESEKLAKAVAEDAGGADDIPDSVERGYTWHEDLRRQR